PTRRSSYLIWVYLLLFRGGFWRTGVRLPIAPEPASWPSVAVVVPARNEELVLGASLPTRRRGAQPGGRAVPVVLAGEEPPPGWSGKLWALAQGVGAVSSAGSGAEPLAGLPAPEFLLLTDADIAH